MKVKGSPQHRSIVVPYRPLYKVVWNIIYILTTLVLVIGSAFFGFRASQDMYSSELEELTQLRMLVVEQDEQLAELTQQVSNTQMSSDVDKQALEALRLEMVALNNEITGLKESNNFYRNLMEPKADRSGLIIGSLKLVPSGQPKRFFYELVMQQLTVNHYLLNGHVTLNIIGTELGLEKVYSLKELSPEVKADTVKLKFRFYQTIEGELTLPEGFEPYRVDVVAEKTGRSPAVVEESFGWVIQS